METSQEIISDEELKALNEALVSRYGVDFSGYELSSYKRRIVRIMHRYGLESTVKLWHKLLYTPEFLPLFRDEISVGLTEMFRNPDLWVYLKNEYMPRMLGKSSIKIWHAGCSTGEEFYTMAILLHELGFLSKSYMVSTDLSERFIQITKEGVFEEDAIKRYVPNYRTFNPYGNFMDYFNQIEGKYHAKDYLKYQGFFFQQNLVSEQMEGRYDIIFCRNVMIYFNDELKMQVLKKFHQHLSDDGVLVIGYFDAMPQQYEQYFDYYDPSFKIFKKVC